MIQRARRPVTRLGLQIPSFSYGGVADEDLFDRIAQVATAAEEAGFDSLWVMDHFYQIRGMGRATEPMLEAYTLLGAIAARTSRPRVGTMVTGVTYRNPALLAKILTTLDVVSSGRAILGIGAAWNEDEHRGYGFDFPPVRERFERLEDALRICRAMFREEAPSFAGRHHLIEQALNFPRPIQPGGPPILVGGSGEKRTLRLVARYADGCNLFGDAKVIRHKLSVLGRHCEAVGRDPSEITKTRLGTLVVADTHEEAARKGAEMRVARRMPQEWYRRGVMEGDPDEIGEQAQELLDAGLDGLIFNMPDAQDLEPVAMAGRALTKLFG